MSTDSERRLYHVKESVQYRPLVEGGILYDESGACVHHLNGPAAIV